MGNSYQLANRVREVILDGTWIANTNYKDQLSSTDWQLATTRLDALNTIALLAQHIHYYIRGVMNVLRGGSLDIKDKFSFDFAPVKSQLDWENFLDRFWSDTREFADIIEQMPEEKLGQIFIDNKYGTYQRNLEGIIEHCYYHLGQIVLIKKMAGKTA